MTDQPKRKSPILITGVLALATLGAVFGTKGVQGYLEYQQHFGTPAATVDQRIAKLAKLGAPTVGETQDFHNAELIGHYQTAKWKEPRVGDETPEIAKTVLADQAEWGKLAALAAAPAKTGIPGPDDFLMKRNAVASKRTAGSLRVFINQSIADGRLEDAVRAMEMLSGLQQAVVPEPCEASFIYWFGINADMMRNMADLSEKPGLTESQRARLKKLVDPDLPVMPLKSILVRYSQEMMVFSAHLADATQEEKDTLDFMTQRQFPDLKQKDMAAAIRGQLAQTFIDVLEKIDFTEPPETLGVKIDDMIEAHQKKGEKIDSYYLVSAVPARFEQFGRMTARILEARAVMNVILDRSFSLGTKEVTVAGFPQKVVVDTEKGRTTVVCKGIDRHGYYKNQNGLEISQELGVRYFVPANAASQGGAN